MTKIYILQNNRTVLIRNSSWTVTYVGHPSKFFVFIVLIKLYTISNELNNYILGIGFLRICANKRGINRKYCCHKIVIIYSKVDKCKKTL